MGTFRAGRDRMLVEWMSRYPDIFVSQVQGPLSMKVLEAASDDGMPKPFGYFGIARVSLGGQEVVISAKPAIPTSWCRSSIRSPS